MEKGQDSVVSESESQRQRREEEERERDADLDALLKNKSYAVVYRDEPYPYWQVEEDFIQFMLEKVVMLRELPYMRAALHAEKLQNIAKMNTKFMTSNLQGTFAAKAINRRGLPIDAYSCMTTQAYDGSDKYHNHQQNKATFKIAKPQLPKITKTTPRREPPINSTSNQVSSRD